MRGAKTVSIHASSSRETPRRRRRACVWACARVRRSRARARAYDVEQADDVGATRQILKDFNLALDLLLLDRLQDLDNHLQWCRQKGAGAAMPGGPAAQCARGSSGGGGGGLGMSESRSVGLTQGSMCVARAERGIAASGMLWHSPCFRWRPECPRTPRNTCRAPPCAPPLHEFKALPRKGVKLGSGQCVAQVFGSLAAVSAAAVTAL